MASPIDIANIEPFTARRALRRILELSRIRAISRFVVGNAAKFGIVAYAYATLFGLFRAAAFYFVNGVNPLAFYDAGDFFLAGVKHPLALVLPVAISAAMVAVGFVASGLTTLVLFAFAPVMRRCMPPLLAAHVCGHLQALVVRLLFLATYAAAAINFVLYLFLVPLVSVSVSEELGCDPVVAVTIKSEGKDAPPPVLPRTIVDGAGKFLFLRNAQTKAIDVVPVEEIVRLTRTLPLERPLLGWCALFK